MDRRRFTLVELAVVVAIIAVLAAVAIPVVAGLRDRAKEAEVGVNIDGMMTSTAGYVQATSVSPAFLTTTGSEVWEPDAKLGTCPRKWIGGPGWDDIAYEPDGLITSTYRGTPSVLPNGDASAAFYGMIDVNLHDGYIWSCKDATNDTGSTMACVRPDWTNQTDPSQGNNRPFTWAYLSGEHCVHYDAGPVDDVDQAL